MEHTKSAMCNMCTCTLRNVYKNKRGKAKGAKGVDRINEWHKCDVYSHTHHTYRVVGECEIEWD